MDIETEKKAKEEALSSKQSIQEKSTSFIQQQQREIEKLHQEKVCLYLFRILFLYQSSFLHSNNHLKEICFIVCMYVLTYSYVIIFK